MSIWVHLAALDPVDIGVHRLYLAGGDVRLGEVVERSAQQPNVTLEDFDCFSD
jgi:hypothetical protein